MKLPDQVQKGSLVRGAGVALACLMPGLTNRTRAVVASYGFGWPLDRPGLQMFVVVPDDDAEDWKKIVVPFATSALSWTLVMTAAATVVRRTRVPVPVAALLLGGLVAVGDSALVEVGEKAKARAQAARTGPADDAADETASTT
jgi:hypothetical protein